jgi:hypothetical protein
MMKKGLGDRVVDSAATKEDTDEEVEISFKKIAWLLIYHNVYAMDPVAEEKSVSSSDCR